jgi:hypothetical protein
VEIRRAFADVRVMGYPLPDGNDSASPVDSKSPQGQALAALALSEMRIEMAEQCHARIILGGGLARFQGLYPGIAEEAFRPLRADRPLYILGGFGGAAKSVYDAITDGRSDGAAVLRDASQKVGAASTEEVRRAHQSFVALSKKHSRRSSVPAGGNLSLAGTTTSFSLKSSLPPSWRLPGGLLCLLRFLGHVVLCKKLAQ